MGKWLCTNIAHWLWSSMKMSLAVESLSDSHASLWAPQRSYEKKSVCPLRKDWEFWPSPIYKQKAKGYPWWSMYRDNLPMTPSLLPLLTKTPPEASIFWVSSATCSQIIGFISAWVPSSFHSSLASLTVMSSPPLMEWLKLPVPPKNPNLFFLPRGHSQSRLFSHSLFATIEDYLFTYYLYHLSGTECCISFQNLNLILS